ncbi:hypothetical protein U1Q18_012835 [Sarracenia purpurea var. burkii]
MNHQDEFRQFQNNHHHHHHLHQQPNSNSGLLRFRSAPTSLFSSFANADADSGENGPTNIRCSSPEAHTQRLTTTTTHLGSHGVHQDLEEIKPLVNGYSLSSQLPPQYPRRSSTAATQLAVMDVGGSYTAAGSGDSSNLIRQTSSPAGVFSHLAPQNGYAALRGIGNYRVGNGTNGDVSPSSSRLRSGPINFSQGVSSSSLGILSQISEMENEGVEICCQEDIKFGNGSRSEPQLFSPRNLFGPWNDSSHFQDNFLVPKKDLDNVETKLFAGSQNDELENRTHIFSKHLSLPKISAEMDVMERLLQFQDTVPCKVRAKRGCATHPRSIAERVRRTRISERMRKLQEIVPNMDKQTNTADMLDLAVEYIKDLQKQYKILSENRPNCKCLSIQKSLPNLSA